MLPRASSRRWPRSRSPRSNAGVLCKRFPRLSFIKAQPLLWRLLLGWRLLLWCCWPWPGVPGARHVLVLPLPVSYDCSQQQRDDSHEIKVPLRSQKLVHINLGKYISNLNGNRKIVMLTNMSEKESGKV